MPYATVTDMQQRYGEAELRQLSDNASPRTGAVNVAVVQNALDDASAWIDSYLAGRYAVPITDAGALTVMRLHCCGEARFLLMTTHPDEVAIAAHAERAAFFGAIAKGQIALIAPTAVPLALGAGPVVFVPGAKVFGRDSDTGGDSIRAGDRREFTRGGW